METRYKSHLYVYLIICGALYVVFSTLRSGGDLQGWFKGVYSVSYTHLTLPTNSLV